VSSLALAPTRVHEQFNMLAGQSTLETSGVFFVFVFVFVVFVLFCFVVVFDDCAEIRFAM